MLCPIEGKSVIDIINPVTLLGFVVVAVKGKE